MGRGDRRTKRGKIWRGTHGNSRPKKKKVTEKSSAQSWSDRVRGRRGRLYRERAGVGMSRPGVGRGPAQDRPRYIRPL